MQEHVGFGDLLQRGPEGRNESGWQLLDETDRIREECLVAARQLHAAGRWVEGCEQLVGDVDVRARYPVEQRGLAGIGVAYECHCGDPRALALCAIAHAVSAHLLELLLEVGN